MRISCGELKRIARAILNDRYRIPMGVFVMSMAILNLCELPFSMLRGDNPTILQNVIYYAAIVLLAILGKLFTTGQYFVHLNMARGKEFALNNIFYAFRNQPDRFLCAYGIIMLFSGIIASPSIVLGVVLQNRTEHWVVPVLVGSILANIVVDLLMQMLFQFVPFVLLDRPNLSVLDSMKLSLSFIKHHFGRVLVIYLSFIGMYLLGILSFGIGFLWILPYLYQTLTILYLDINGEISVSKPQTQETEV